MRLGLTCRRRRATRSTSRATWRMVIPHFRRRELTAGLSMTMPVERGLAESGGRIRPSGRSIRNEIDFNASVWVLPRVRPQLHRSKRQPPGFLLGQGVSYLEVRGEAEEFISSGE